MGGCQQQLVITQGPGGGWGRTYNEQHRGDDDFGLTPPAFVEQILMPAGRLVTDPRTPSGMLTLSFPSLGWGHSVPGGTGWHAGGAVWRCRRDAPALPRSRWEGRKALQEAQITR